MKSKKYNLPVTSREYKLLLNPKNFENRSKGSEDFWKLFSGLVENSGGEYFRYVREYKRRTWFLDTEENELASMNFILRCRDEEDEKEKFKLTLKYRNPDRYISASKNLNAGEEFETKFEEDILPPFVSKFSHSVSLKFSELKYLKKFKHIVELFPGLKELEIKGKSPLVIVNNFKAFEMTRWIGAFYYGNKIPVKACINFWFRNSGYNGIPMIAEFSFDYSLKDVCNNSELEKYPEKIVTNCSQIFADLQNKKEWFIKSSITKTRIAYDLI